jgi:hypothetical protein
MPYLNSRRRLPRRPLDLLAPTDRASVWPLISSGRAYLNGQRAAPCSYVAPRHFAYTCQRIDYAWRHRASNTVAKGRCESMDNNNAVPADMREELDQFEAAANEIVTAFESGLMARAPPPIVYHYTNDVGLKGILETGKLWLSDIFSLNDPSELTHGFSFANSILSARATDDETKSFATRFDEFATRGGLSGSAHFFSCSFSSCADDLGQWRAYADNGRGYSMGFETKQLKDAFSKASADPNFRNDAFPLTYDDARLCDIHRRLIERMFHLITFPTGRSLPGEVIAKYMADLGFFLSISVLRSALLFKHEAYNNEKEYRFLQQYGAVALPDVKFRMRPYSLVRYREFDWRSIASNALKRIVIGPCADQQRGPQFAKDCAREFHPGDVDIRLSSVLTHL